MANANETSVRPQQLADEAVALVTRWVREAQDYPVDASAAQLAGLLRDPQGLDFTVGFVDGVVRPEDYRAAARTLRQLSPATPGFLAAPMKAAVGVGALVSTPLPGVVVPVARRVLRQMVSHLLIDATDSKLGAALKKIKRDGVRLNVNLLGEAILGDREAQKRLAGTHKLLAHPEVDYVSIKVSSTVAPHNHWAFDEAVDHITTQLLPLFRQANKEIPKKFINLDMEEYKDLDLTLAVFTRIMDRPEFMQLSAGIVLQAYLPDALGAMMSLQEWSARRVAAGGAPIKVRVVKGANLPMEKVDAAIHGWPTATWNSKQESDTSYKAVLDYALTAERVANVRVGVAGHNLFDVALAWLLAKARGAADGVEFEMLLGMATGEAEAVRKDVGDLLLYVPVVHPREFDVAIAYLIRRLEEGASSENFMSAVFELNDSESLFERERTRFLASLAELENITGDGSVETFTVPQPQRQQDRRVPHDEGREARVDARVAQGREGRFTNTPDTDPDLPGNREWGREISARMVDSQLGNARVAASMIGDIAELDAVLARGVAASAQWRSLGADQRARILYQAAESLESARADLLEVMGSECGKTLDQGDPEVSEAVDFANYYAMLGQTLSDVEGATAVPPALVAVIPPWNFPTAIPAGGVLAALAAGSAVVVKPASAAARTGAVMVEALWKAGVPKEVLQMVQFKDRELASSLAADSRVGRLILTGSYDTAVRLRELREDLPILAETSGKNAIIVTPHADLDLAARDVVHSAFGHAGQKCSAASLLIVVGSVAKSRRFLGQLIDATTSLEVGTPEVLTTQMGPVISAPSGKLLRGLTTLGEGERWLVKPKPLPLESPLAKDPSGATKVWSPGIRAGVRRGSEFHLTEYFGPILGIMRADTLEEAIEMVNEIDYGLTSGLHSLDREEISIWLDRIQAGNLYVNRGITGAIVRRQPFGGWKKSAIGPGTKAGGPNYLHGIVGWEDAPVHGDLHSPRAAVEDLVQSLFAVGLSESDQRWFLEAVSSDAQAWDSEFGVARDVSQVGIEANVLRYHPVPVLVRMAADASLVEIARVLAASIAAEAPSDLSTPVALPAQLRNAIEARGITVSFDDEAAWEERVAALARREGPDAGARIRLVAGATRQQLAARVASVSNGKPDIAVYAGPVVRAGRVEMLPFVREQAVSITAHRFGTPNDFASLGVS